MDFPVHVQPDVPAFCGILDRIRYQIRQSAAQQQWVGPDFAFSAGDNVDGTLAGQAFEVIQDAFEFIGDLKLLLIPDGVPVVGAGQKQLAICPRGDIFRRQRLGEVGSAGA